MSNITAQIDAMLAQAEKDALTKKAREELHIATRAEWERRLLEEIGTGRHTVAGNTDPQVVMMAIIHHAAFREHERFLAGEPFSLMEGAGVTRRTEGTK